MTDHIISRDTIRARARAAFEAGRGRDEHNMNWHAPALPTWLAEWDRCAAEVNQNRWRYADAAPARLRAGQ